MRYSHWLITQTVLQTYNKCNLTRKLYVNAGIQTRIVYFTICTNAKLPIKIVSEYDQEILQSQTADKPMAPRG